MLTPGVLGPALCVCLCVLLPVSLCVVESLTILLQAGVDVCVCVYLSVPYNRLNDPVTYSMWCQDKKTQACECFVLLILE